MLDVLTVQEHRIVTTSVSFQRGGFAMDSPDDFRHVFDQQLRDFDQELTEFRSVYDSFGLAERRSLREWLEAVNAVENKCPFDWSLRVQVQHDEFDTAGEKVDERHAEFTAGTMLHAINCWDQGKPFAPNTISP